jgi:hypothetical protein
MPTLYITIWPPEVFGAKKSKQVYSLCAVRKKGGDRTHPPARCAHQFIALRILLLLLIVKRAIDLKHETFLMTVKIRNDGSHATVQFKL